MTLDVAKLEDDLIRDEGLCCSAYRDSEGYLTIGIGRMIDERLGGGITENEARFLLRNDIANATADLDRNLTWWRGLSEPRQRALANMALNLGWDRLRKFQGMLGALRSGDYDKAAAEALDSKWATQVGKRAWRIAALIRGHEETEYR